LSAITEGTLLGGRVAYRQLAAGHRSGFEPVLLAGAVPAQAGQSVLELGTGAGAALLCLGTRVPGISGVGVEIDPALAVLANENFKNNNLTEFSSVVGDAARLPFGPVFDHAFANPPWHDAVGTASPDGKRALAHQAAPGLLAAWVAAMAAAAKPRGTVTVIIPAGCFAGAAAALVASNCGAVTQLPLWPRAGQPAKLVIVSARKGAKGPDRILPGLILHDAAGITKAAQAVLREGAALA
jgi:tRNA1(Val) A37 N6-methylase TrmN6